MRSDIANGEKRVCVKWDGPGYIAIERTTMKEIMETQDAGVFVLKLVYRKCLFVTSDTFHHRHNISIIGISY